MPFFVKVTKKGTLRGRETAILRLSSPPAVEIARTAQLEARGFLQCQPCHDRVRGAQQPPHVPGCGAAHVAAQPRPQAGLQRLQTLFQPQGKVNARPGPSGAALRVAVPY